MGWFERASRRESWSVRRAMSVLCDHNSTTRTICPTPVRSMPNLAIIDNDHTDSRKDTRNTRPHNHSKTPDSTMPVDRHGFHHQRTNRHTSYSGQSHYDESELLVYDCSRIYIGRSGRLTCGAVTCRPLSWRNRSTCFVRVKGGVTWVGTDRVERRRKREEGMYCGK